MVETIDQSLFHTVYIRNLRKQQFIGILPSIKKRIANVFYEPIQEIDFIGNAVKEITHAKW